ncbi:MAG TPA: Ig domain-containing protein, partial [Firmicutes bacterium]|nr:Ig domain-containing protein [Bacillota bacterium]
YGSFLIGMLSGLMPCGPLQIVELYALGTGSALFGALSMFCFAMGTVPLLFTLGTLHSTLLKKYTHSILKISAILVIFLGLVMIGRGLALSGIVTFGFENTVAADTGISHVAGNIQTVVTSIKSERYPTIVVQQGIPVRWIIKADSKNLNGCNQAITIPKLKIVKKLRVGENLIEFTPHKIGDIIYTCWMGMIKSQITVVVDIAKVKFKRK